MRPSVVSVRRDAVDARRETRLGVELVEIGRDVDERVELVAAQPEGVGEREQDPPDLFLLALDERDDVVVELDRRHAARRTGSRRSPTLPCTMPGTDFAMLGAHDDDVAAVAIGDDLILQVLRRVAPLRQRLERRSQLRALAAERLADVAQRRAGGVRDLAAAARRADRGVSGSNEAARIAIRCSKS